MQAKVRLHSDFLDYYDHHLDREGVPFYRMSRDNLDRKSAIWLLKGMGCRTPQSGLVSELAKYTIKRLVVYLDPFAHRGEGKVLLDTAEALARYPDRFATEFVVAKYARRPVSYRYLRVGERGWWLQYHSDDAWRSNVGDVTVFPVGETDQSVYFRSMPDRPLWAADFIDDVAIDFNGSPGIKGTGIEDILKPAECAALIRDWYSRRTEPPCK